MVSHTHDLMASTLKIYDGFKDVKTVVDVGGGVGTAILIIVKYHTHLGINFILPYVIATTPVIPGVEHVGGNIFKQIPLVDTIFIKWILHDWDNEDCMRILNKCREAI
eukprot:Gb_25044 [translate_table: standard]